MNPITVTQLNSYVKRVLTGDPVLRNISVEGEISNLKHHPTGVYFSLKDASSKASCYISPSTSEKLSCELKEGNKIVAHGYISVYERGGTYSVYISDIEDSGKGDLTRLFEELKQKLLNEGIFDENHKKPLPAFPKRIAVVTSPTGAAVEDIKKIITHKNDYVNLLIYPVLVQGPRAAASIADAINDLNSNFDDIDLMIVGRGGGSLEELWAFNEEVVARAIYQSRIPVISAVGHETDFTISDFAADRRAETPTAAANMAVPDINEIRMYLEDIKSRLLDNLKLSISRREDKLNLYNIDQQKMRLMDKLTIAELKCKGFYDTLSQLNPEIIMAKGYSILTDSDGKIISGIKDASGNPAVTEGTKLKVLMRDGKLNATVESIEV